MKDRFNERWVCSYCDSVNYDVLICHHCGSPMRSLSKILQNFGIVATNISNIRDLEYVFYRLLSLTQRMGFKQEVTIQIQDALQRIRDCRHRFVA